jgi:hypothetical protein
MMGFPGHHKCPRILHCFSSQERNRGPANCSP